MKSLGVVSIWSHGATQWHVRFGSKADMCSAQADVRFGPEADITELGCHQRLDFTSLTAGPVAPLPFHRSPLSSSKPKQLG